MKPTTFVQNNNHKIPVYEGPDNGTPIIFLHGNSLGAETFEKQLNSELKNKNHLLSFDFRGHNNTSFASDPENEYAIDTFVQEIKMVIDEFELKKPVLVGHSFGGHIALHYASDIGGLSGICIFGTPPLPNPPDLSSATFPHPALPLAFKPDLSDDEINQLAKMYIGEPHIAKTMDLIKRTDPMFRQHFIANLMKLDFEDETEIANKLCIPICIMHGEDDPAINVAYFKSLSIPTLFNENIQLIPNAGHSPQIENPDAFNAVLNGFIESL